MIVWRFFSASKAIFPSCNTSLPPFSPSLPKTVTNSRLLTIASTFTNIIFNLYPDRSQKSATSYKTVTLKCYRCCICVRGKTCLRCIRVSEENVFTNKNPWLRHFKFAHNAFSFRTRRTESIRRNATVEHFNDDRLTFTLATIFV